MQNISVIMLFLIFGLFTQLRPVSAACNFHQLMTDTSKDVSNFTSTCTITAVEGVDNPQNSETSTTTDASITLATNSAITINNGGTLAVNSLSITGGSIAIQTGGQIKLNTPLYIADDDADGHAVDFTLYTASASGRRRLGLMSNFTTVDCNDGSALVFTSHAQCYADADGDTYTAGLAADTACLNTSSCATATKASASTTGAAVTTYTAGRLANAANGSDCNDTGTNAANVYVSATCYADADNDDYGTGTAKSCTNNATCGSATWASGGAGTAAASGNFAANATDCYDANANAKPGSTTCSTTHRGDGSYDYNCSGTNTKCGTTYNYATTASSYTRSVGLGSCNNNNCRCATVSNNQYSPATFNCGETGAICTGSSSFEYGCNEDPKCGGDCVPSGTTSKCTSIATGVQSCQ